MALMVSRVLNIWVIKQRAKPPQPELPNPDFSNILTQYLIDLGHGRSVCLRGMADDLQAITTSSWLLDKTDVDGYLEAMAKLIVFVVAALSGNMSQAGGIIFMGLLIVSAGLLALSNANAQTFKMHGRIAAPTPDRLPYPSDRPLSPGSRNHYDGSDDIGSDGIGSTGSGSTSFPATTQRTDTGLTSTTDWAEKG